jgi:membrane-associated phospholipid phosphatase
MHADPTFACLLRRTLAAAALAAGLVGTCYFLIDRPTAWWVHDRGINHIELLQWLTDPPPIVQAWAPLVLAGLAVRRAWGPFRRWELALFAALIALVLADQFRESLSFVFGRYWPDTWIDHNPSLIRNNAYGFHPFHSGAWYGSFPSGHTARTAAFVAVFWVAFPRSWWACVLAVLAEAVGLVGMNYHFVGDVVAGGFVGGLVGVWAAYLVGLGESTQQLLQPPEQVGRSQAPDQE